MNSQRLLTLVLAGATDDELVAAIRDVVAQKLREDHFVEFKDGSLFEDASRPTTEIRKTICGFANAEGGVLVLGVKEVEHAASKISGCSNDASRIASRALSGLASVRPVIREIQIDESRIVLIGVARSPSLVTFWASAKVECHLRIGESTHPVPEYLRMDLVLGRRERASFGIEGTATLNNSPIPQQFAIEWVVRVTNESLTWSDRVRIGLMCLGQVRLRRDEGRINVTSPALNNMVRILDSDHSRASPNSRSSHLVADITNIGPLDCIPFPFSVRLPMHEDQMTWVGALYVVATNSSVQWFSLEAHYDGAVTTLKVHANIHRVPDKAPVIYWGTQEGWEDFDED